jgi:glycosyltransferase involved in cell wall biosynthesis
VVLTCHGAAGGGHRRLSSLEERWTDAVVAVSRGAAEQVPSPLLRMRSEVIPNGVQPTLPARDRAAVRADLGLEPDQVAVAMVARIDGKKGHDTLVRALARPPKGARIVALVAGEGDAAPAIRELAAELGLGPERLRMLGLRRDVPDLLHASDIFVLPSLYEGLPLSILEAMSQGLPVVATPVGGIPEVVTQGREGILVPKEDPAALAAAVQRLAGDADLRARLGSAGRQRALSEFSFETMLDRYDRLYRRLVFGVGAERSPNELSPAAGVGRRGDRGGCSGAP